MRVQRPDQSEGSGLAMARSLGDAKYKPYGVVHDPTITCLELTAEVIRTHGRSDAAAEVSYC